MKNTILIILIGAILFLCLHVQTIKTRQDQMLQLYAEIGLREATASYNRGYRAGRFEALAQFVECEGMNTPQVIRDYHVMEEILEDFGELDTTPYSCEE